MDQFGATNVIDRVWDLAASDDRDASPQNSVLVVRDPDRNSEYLESVCEFLEVQVQHATNGDDLRTVLAALRPMAVIADVDGEIQDGFHVMKMAADFDRSMPILLLTGYDTALLGAIDAVQEVWGLTRVATVADTSGVGPLVDFICQAARDAGRQRMVRA